MNNTSFIIGRSPESSLVINNHFVSRNHAELFVNKDGAISIRDVGSSNGTGIGSMDNLVQEAELREMDLVFFSEDYPVPGGVLIKHFINWRASGGKKRASLTLGDVKMFSPGTIRIGSSTKADVRLPVLGIAPEHIQVFYDRGWKVRDLVGGAAVDGKLLGSAAVIPESGCVIELESESVSLTFSDQQMIIARQRKGFSLQAENVSLTVKDLNTGDPRDLLKDISLSILPGELVALMGPSGSGKTTLLNILAGIHSASQGGVKYDGVSINAGDVSSTTHTGYVPQDDLLYGELTVAESLYYSTRFRVPDAVSDGQIKHKVAEVCNTLGLNARIRDTLVGSTERKTLSGGQRKRVNLAMELVTDPLVLFLDEPTSGLSSRDARVVVEALRDLATTMCIPIIVTIHQPSMRVYQNFDKVIYLKDGKLVYYGNAFPDGVSYFIDNEAPEVAGSDAVMEEIEDRDAAVAAQQYQQTGIYHKFVTQRDVLLAGLHAGNGRLPTARDAESWQQQVVHASERYSKCRLRDRRAMVIQVMQGPLVGILLGMGLSSVDVRTPLFLLVFVALWFGTNNTARELVGDRGLFRREKRSGASVMAMLLSKLGMNGLVTLAQCCLLVVFSGMFLDININSILAILICWLVSLVGISVGLLISALAKTDVAAIVITPMVLIPFILFGGLLAPLDSFEASATTDGKPVANLITQSMPSRWGYEAIIHAEKLAYEPGESMPSVSQMEFRSEHKGISKSKRRGKIATCILVLLMQFCSFFYLVWLRVKMPTY